MVARFFITGTDTNCGKTYATSLLLNNLKTQNKIAAGLKPVASGCDLVNDKWINEDIVLLEKFSNPVGEICPWRLKDPVSPNIAANRDKVFLSAHDIAEFCLQEKFSHLDYLLIEGAGGLLVPLNDKETWLDFLTLTQIPVIFVVGMRLGCLNHALLTAAVMAEHNIECSGWVANCLDPQMLALEENIEILSAKLSYPHLGTIGFDDSHPRLALPG